MLAAVTWPADERSERLGGQEAYTNHRATELQEGFLDICEAI
jgi:hypothetical protein